MNMGGRQVKIYATLLAAQEIFGFQDFQVEENYINKIMFPISAGITNKNGLHCSTAMSS
jgi:hypothetical protein